MTHSLKAMQYLVNLVSGTNALPVAAAPLEIMLKIARANGLLLAAGNALGGVTNLPADYQKLYQTLKLLEANSLTVMRTFLKQCRAQQLSIFTIKTFLPFSYVDSNIDIVAVESKELDRYRQLIKRLGFVRYRNLADVREPDKEMYFHIEHGRVDKTFPKLHLHQSISWNGIIYIDTNQVWLRHQAWQVEDVSIPVPSPEDELLIMVAHAMFENKFITLSELIYLNWLTTNHNLNWNYIVQTARNRFWYDALTLFLATAYTLGNALKIDIRVELALPKLEERSSVSLPWIIPLPQTLRPALLKLWQDVQHGRLAELPRQLFTYFLVDCLWMYYKAQRKAAKAKQ